MATFRIDGLEEFSLSLDEIAKIPDAVLDEMIAAQADIIEAAQKASAEAFGVKDTGIMQSSIGRGKPRRTKDGRSVSIYPRGSRKRGNTSVREAEIGFINEFGKKGQSARPFIKTANERHAEEAVNASEKIYRNYVESKLRKG